MSCIRFEKTSFGYTDPLFNNITFSIHANDRIGIVGNNGCGKSTLLKCMTGELQPQSGRVIFQKGIKFGLMEQDVPDNARDYTLFDFISTGIPAQERSISGWKVDTTLDIFNASNAIREKPIKELSGGWQRLALIARLVVSNPDVLILDEPTNHLDMKQIETLETWLNQQVYDIPLICVSHDRHFLDHCTNKTFFLRGATIHEYQYSYSRARILLNEDDHAALSQRQKETKEMNRLKRSAHELRQIGVNNYSDAALKKSVQIARRAETIETNLTNIHTESKRAIKLSNREFQSKRLIGLENINIFSPDGALLYHIAQLDIRAGDRLIIRGANGSGKTQLLTFIHQAIKSSKQTEINGVFVSPSIEVGYIDQQLSHLPMDKTLQDYLASGLSLDMHKRTSALIDAGFPIYMHSTKLAALSHGQRLRIAFLMLHLLKPNFYVMDEPTNHLDIAGQEQLEREMLEQNAASIVVSHDRVFTQQIGTKFYEINNKKLIKLSD